jgi:hypothetical protein
VPQPQRRRKKSPPPPPQDCENGKERKEMSSVNCGVRIKCPADCHCACHCVKWRDSNEQLRNNKQKARRCHSE